MTNINNFITHYLLLNYFERNILSFSLSFYVLEISTQFLKTHKELHGRESNSPTVWISPDYMIK